MNSISAARPRMQQQPRRFMDRQQQQSSGSGEFQPRRQSGGDRAHQAGEMACMSCEPSQPGDVAQQATSDR